MVIILQSIALIIITTNNHRILMIIADAIAAIGVSVIVKSFNPPELTNLNFLHFQSFCPILLLFLFSPKDNF